MFLMTGEMQTLRPKGTPISFFNKGNHGNNKTFEHRYFFGDTNSR
jgi:hypothetical protein